MAFGHWVKRLGQWHLYRQGESTTLCGMPMLGNNYSKIIPEKERKTCTKCATVSMELAFNQPYQLEVKNG